MYKTWVKLLVALLFYVPAMSQVTSGTLIGSVVNSEGKPIAGASIEAVHEPSGTRYKTQTTNDGRYNLPGIRIGGPYKISYSHVGCSTVQSPNKYHC